ncbi:MAG TPA: PDZ domain-containing protein, partial [Candidatus Polarisedimenticolia bacterium]|nr:PDZ domain-containing protein [Candidatus Polarisedimenticolia bacterium]
STSGNSGGPLVSVRGLVLGVNDMGFVGSKGQGYSIPSRMASLVVERLRSKGTYQRGFLGLQIRPVDSELIERFSIRRNTGIVVESVLSGTPAEAAGFKPGDVIFGINGRALPEVYIFQEAISSVGPNGTVQILLDRGGKEMGVSITTGLRPAVPRIDPVSDLERHIQARFVEDPKKQKVYVRVTNPFSLARLYGFTDGIRVESVLPAQNWTEKPLNPVVFRAAHPIEVRNLADLRGGLKRMYLEGRIGVALGLRADRFAIEELVINALVLEEKLAIIV